MIQRTTLILFLFLSCLLAGSVEKPELDNSVAAQLKSFTIADGYEINLFASEKDGIANPITMRWDAKGRLWVLCSWAYPQIEPLGEANDKLLILEDTNEDGRADKTTVFADKLHMPMGFALGEGGVFIAAGRDLLFLKDINGDDQADTREVFFTGFGTGDTHQNINSLTWSPDGELYFTQGLHTFSRVETPWGIERLDEYGAWRMRPRRRQLHAFPRVVGGGNPWGIEFGNAGEVLVKSNGKNFGDLIPVLVPYFQGRSPNPSIGETKIKSMIVKKIDSPHLPKDIQGDVLIAGYMASDINRLSIKKEGSNFKAELKENLLDSSSRSFRPVDIQLGPEGAIYIADWYNPIIGHYQASLRHPDRDKAHGRIWRITAKGRPLAKRPNLDGLSIKELVEKLSSERSWERHYSKRLLSEKESSSVVASINKWLVDKGDRELLEAIHVLASHEVVDLGLLKRLLKSKDELVRALATRLAGRWADRIPKPLLLLEEMVNDPEPRVRIEAMVAVSNVRDVESMRVILKALNHPEKDASIYVALERSIKSLQPLWEPALVSGELVIDEPEHLAHLMKNMNGDQQISFITEKMDTSKLNREAKLQLLLTLAQNRHAKVQSIVFELGQGIPKVLQALIKTGIKPDVNFQDQLKTKVEKGSLEAMSLIGSWSYKSLLPVVEKEMKNLKNHAMRGRAIKTYAELKLNKAITRLQEICRSDNSIACRITAFKALYKLNPKKGGEELASLLKVVSNQEEIMQIVSSFLQKRSGLNELIKLLKRNLPSKDKGTMIRSVLVSHGKPTLEFDKLFIKGNQYVVGMPEYSSELIRQLVESMKSKGDIFKGQNVYRSARASCVACHQVNGNGGVLGPDLSALGNALSPELIVESVLWPKRQLKEGYISTTFSTKNGSLVQGNLVSENDKMIVVKDVSGKESTYQKSEIKYRQPDGTLMPDGLVAALTHEELRDMLTYLTSLK